VLNKKGRELSLAAEAYEPKSGRVLEVWTTEPGLQLYTGNFLYNVHGKGGKVYNKRDAFCLEAQHFPDSPNQPGFPSTVLEPNGRYTETTVYKFTVREAGKGHSKKNSAHSFCWWCYVRSSRSSIRDFLRRQTCRIWRD